MYTASTLGLFLAGVAVILAMPGPTNTLLAAAGLRQGFLRSARLTGAELAGYLISITVWGRFLEQAAQAFPWLPAVVRVAASVYIAYLSIRMWRAAQTVPSAAQQVIGMRTLFVATLLNPKGILFASAIFPPAAFFDRVHVPDLHGDVRGAAGADRTDVGSVWRVARQPENQVDQSGASAARGIGCAGNFFAEPGLGGVSIGRSEQGGFIRPAAASSRLGFRHSAPCTRR